MKKKNWVLVWVSDPNFLDFGYETYIFLDVNVCKFNIKYSPTFNSYNLTKKFGFKIN